MTEKDAAVFICGVWARVDRDMTDALVNWRQNEREFSEWFERDDPNDPKAPQD